MTYKLLISYEGTHYCGWQIQPNGVSIQSLIEKALSTALREPTTLVGASRTDSGVHALGQIAHFRTEVPLDTQKLRQSLNGLLPSDIRVMGVEKAQSTFHARYHAKAKIYHYFLHTAPSHNPFQRHYRTYIGYRMDPTLLKAALACFVGTHDFTTFANEASQGSAAKNPIRTIYRIELFEESEGWRVEFEGNGFLYKMIRNLMGTALAAACGKIEIEDIPKLLAARDRRQAFQTAPAQGLFLVQVIY